MSQTGKETMTIHLLFNISRSKGNQTIKVGQLIKHNVINTFTQNMMQEMRRGDYFQTSFCFLKTLYEVKASGQHFSLFW